MVRRWAPVVLWMAVVFFVSSLSRLGPWTRFPDWISHPLEYAVGAVLVCRALGGDREHPPARPLTVRAALVATLLSTAYGVTDEYHQSFVPGRTADPADVGRDLVGAAAASFIYRRWSTGTARTLAQEAAP